jgi:pantetheine-phosphate adenylyltransferase
MVTAFIPGTFDPITLGHMDVIRRAGTLFDQLVIGVANGGGKQPLISLEKRLIWLQELFKTTHIKVVPIDGLLVDCVKAHGAKAIVRGVRNGTDLDYESQLAGMNHHLADDIETLLLLPQDQYRSITSTLVREIYRLGKDINRFVPPSIAAHLDQERHHGT